ncbi:hypothetical protein K788_00003395 [Paraburkholderia caribensis MBA4]|uniref:Uncharacterized protein n=1 Tax=Paraburkholderia caribensis MBA4 TaxID=1323664 RepID=A0A0P0RI91_9BURK|nr:hypothetical protein [Paraburkholderia caribensis]ALL68297.1 hypothetical protein K788_00003395 [Paraburkholderia caribensis MBA4]
MNSIKALAVAAFLIAGTAVAQAQESTPVTTTAQTENQAQSVSRTGDASTTTAYEKSDIHSGYNTGPTQANVKDCVGPVSYCNIYFGS